MLRAVGDDRGLRRSLEWYLAAASLRCQASSIAGVTAKISGQRLRGRKARQRREPQSVSRVVPDPADMTAEYRVLVREHQQFGSVRRSQRNSRKATLRTWDVSNIRS